MNIKIATVKKETDKKEEYILLGPCLHSSEKMQTSL